jgi:hypothetical protein
MKCRPIGPFMPSFLNLIILPKNGIGRRRGIVIKKP